MAELLRASDALVAPPKLVMSAPGLNPLAPSMDWVDEHNLLGGGAGRGIFGRTLDDIEANRRRQLEAAARAQWQARMGPSAQVVAAPHVATTVAPSPAERLDRDAQWQRRADDFRATNFSEAADHTPSVEDVPDDTVVEATHHEQQQMRLVCMGVLSQDASVLAAPAEWIKLAYGYTVKYADRVNPQGPNDHFEPHRLDRREFQSLFVEEHNITDVAERQLMGGRFWTLWLVQL